MNELVEYTVGIIVGGIIFILTHPYWCRDPKCRFNRWWFTK
ncbi:MAG: hypothetical protein HMLIMOIP_002673 [Candidatus Nitrosomirales archaeon]|jgi:hypothetical protein